LPRWTVTRELTSTVASLYAYWQVPLDNTCDHVLTARLMQRGQVRMRHHSGPDVTTRERQTVDRALRGLQIERRWPAAGTCPPWAIRLRWASSQWAPSKNRVGSAAIGRRRCWIAITTPSSVSAATASSGGNVLSRACNEWCRPTVNSWQPAQQPATAEADQGRLAVRGAVALGHFGGVGLERCGSPFLFDRVKKLLAGEHPPPGCLRTISPPLLTS